MLALTSIELAYGALRGPDAVVETVDRGGQGGAEEQAMHIFSSRLPEPLADEISDNGAAYAWRRAVNDGLRAALGRRA